MNLIFFDVFPVKSSIRKLTFTCIQKEINEETRLKGKKSEKITPI